MTCWARTESRKSGNRVLHDLDPARSLPLGGQHNSAVRLWFAWFKTIVPTMAAIGAEAAEAWYGKSCLLKMCSELHFKEFWQPTNDKLSHVI